MKIILSLFIGMVIGFIIGFTVCALFCVNDISLKKDDEKGDANE